MRKDRKNAGFTLIELIVVVAIMGIMTGVVSLSLGLIVGTNVKKCAQTMHTAIEQTRVNSMSRAGESSIKFYVDTDQKKIFYQATVGGSVIEDKELGNASSVTVTYHLAGETGDRALSTDPLTVTFNRSTGAFAGSQSVDKIRISGGSKNYTITCYQLTGKTTLE